MKKNLLMLLVVILMASVTLAAGGGTRITGVITAIDPVAQTIVVNGLTIQINDTTTIYVTLNPCVIGSFADLDVGDRIGFRQHRHRARRRVDASLRLGLGHALHAVPPRLELELRVRALARDPRDHLAVATEFRGRRRHDLDLPALALGVARVHAEQVAREECALVAARARANLEEHVAHVVRVLREQRGLQLERERVHALLRCGALLVGKRLHRGVRRHLVGRGEIGLRLPPRVEALDDRRHLGVLPRVRAEAVHVARRLGRGKQVVELGEPCRELFEASAEGELHEGTDIAPSREYGRKYVELTAKYAGLWRSKARLDRPGAFGKAREVHISLGEKNAETGLVQKDIEDGKTEPRRAAGKDGRKTTGPSPGRYIYFDADDSFFFDDTDALEVEFEYLDGAGGQIVLEYDSTDPGALLSGAFKAAAPVPLGGSGAWKVARIRLPDPAFTGRANGQDFRLSVPGGDLVLSRVEVRKDARD